MQIHCLKIFETNYVWVLKVDFDVVVIDPGESKVIVDYITANNLNLIAIMLTHGHLDHVGGVDELINLYNVPVYAGLLAAKNTPVKAKIIAVDKELIIFPGIEIKVINTPGHTLDGVSYLIQANGHQYLFCGDTLFAAGCGRVFTNDYNAMLTSLNKIKDLSDEVEIYPAHEYTLNNLEFARFVESDNSDVLARLETENTKFQNIGITLPTTLRLEKLTNPFLRTDKLKTAVEKITNSVLNNELEVFTQLRKLKDNFTK
jgi:hydroxyacylglutathione hydrolase